MPSHGNGHHQLMVIVRAYVDTTYIDIDIDIHIHIYVNIYIYIYLYMCIMLYVLTTAHVSMKAKIELTVGLTYEAATTCILVSELSCLICAHTLICMVMLAGMRWLELACMLIFSICLGTCSFLHVYVYVDVKLCAYVHVYAYAYTYACMCLGMCACICIHICIGICIRTCI